MKKPTSPEPRRSAPILLRLRCAAWALLAFAASSCAAIGAYPQAQFGLETSEERSMSDLMQWHSGRVEVYRDFGTVFHARAAYITEAVRAAAVDWEARTSLLNPAERKSLDERTLAMRGPNQEVILGFYAPIELGGLDSPEGGWRVSLEYPDGRQSRAVCLEAAPEFRKLYLRFLKWDLAWLTVYRVCFPSEPGSRPDPVRLVISGPAGKGGMVLKTVPPAAKEP